MKMSTTNSAAKNEIPGILVSAPEPLPANEVSPGQETWGWAELCRIARHQIDKFISLVPATLRDENLEAINKVRVTARRLEEILDLLYCEPRPRRIKKFHRQLKACRRTLGDLRNYDALLTMVNESLALKTTSNIKVWEALKEYLLDRRLQEGHKTLEKLGRINMTASYLRLKRDLDSEALFQLLSKNGEMIREDANRGNDLNQRIMKSLDDRWRAFEQAVEKSRLDPREEVIHRMRTAAKRLRYLTEAMEKLQIERSSETLSWLCTLQEVVGLWHDRELLQHALSDMLAQPKFHDDHPGLSEDVRRIIRHNREVKQQLERKFSWMTSHSRHYHGTREWVAEVLISGNLNGVSKDSPLGPLSAPAPRRSGRQH